MEVVTYRAMLEKKTRHPILLKVHIIIGDEKGDFSFAEKRYAKRCSLWKKFHILQNI